MFEFLKHKKITETEQSLNKLTELKLEIETKRNELRALIAKAFPIGGLVGIYCNKETPSCVIVGHLFIDGKTPMLQIVGMNPRCKNGNSVSNISHKDAKFHGFASQLKIPPSQYVKE